MLFLDLPQLGRKKIKRVIDVMLVYNLGDIRMNNIKIYRRHSARIDSDDELQEIMHTLARESAKMA